MEIDMATGMTTRVPMMRGTEMGTWTETRSTIKMQLEMIEGMKMEMEMEMEIDIKMEIKTGTSRGKVMDMKRELEIEMGLLRAKVCMIF